MTRISQWTATPTSKTTLSVAGKNKETGEEITVADIVKIESWGARGPYALATDKDGATFELS